MKLYTLTGMQIIGTKETVPGTALAQEYKPDGEPIYDGETKIWWDDQTTVWEEGSRVYICEDGEEYTFDELITEEQHLKDEAAEDAADDADFERMLEEERLSGYDRHTMNQD